MKQKCVMYNGSVEVVEYPAVAVQDPVLVKPFYVYIGDVERSIVQGQLPVTKPVILGSLGVVKVVEVLEGPTEPTGKDFVVSPLGDKGILGVDINGLLATHTTLTHSYLDEELVQSSPYDSLRPVVKHAAELANASEEPVLVEGCGLVGVATGLSLRKMGVEPIFYCEDGGRRASSLGFNVYKHAGSIGTKWRTVVLTSTSISSKHTLLTGVEYQKVVISPLSFTTWMPIRSRQSSLTRVFVVWRTGNYSSEIVREVIKELSKYVKVINVQDIEKILGLIPPKGWGSILVLRG